MAAVKITVGADLSPAQQEINQFQAATAAAAKQAGNALATGVEQGATKAATAIGGVTNAADRAASATESIATKMNLADKIGAIGAFKDAIEKGIGPLLGFEDATTKAVTRGAELAQVGATFGKAFGPQWALALGVVGGALGLAASAADRFTGKTKELADAKNKLDLATKANTANEALYRVEVEKNGFASIEAIKGRIKALREEAIARNEVEKAGGPKESWATYEARAEEIEKKFSDLADAAGAVTKNTVELKKELGILPKDTLSQLETNATKTRKAFEDADKRVVSLKSEIESIDSTSLTRLEEKTIELESETRKLASASMEAKEANVKYAAAQKEAELAAASAKGAVGGAAGAYKDLANNANDATTAIVEYTVMTVTVFDETTGKVKANLVNIGMGFDENRRKLVEGIAKSREELDKLTGGPPNVAALKAKTDAEIEAINKAIVEGNPIVVPMVIQPDPEGITIGMAALRTVADEAQADLKEAGKAFLNDALAASVAKVAENVAKGEKAYRGLGAAVGEVAKEQILALGKTWAFKAGGEAAEAVANLAIGNIPGATLHGQAALMFGALAAAAGVGAGLLGRALPSEAETATAPTSPSGGSSSSGGASFGGGSTFTELPGVTYNLAPGGYIVFPGDNRGEAQFGRHTGRAINSGAAAIPKLKRT